MGFCMYVSVCCARYIHARCNGNCLTLLSVCILRTPPTTLSPLSINLNNSPPPPSCTTHHTQVSAARPKIANYPFTTLVPNLGVCEMDFRTTVFADVPGLLEGAHTGVGLGHEFLRHCQRCRLLVHVIDGSSRDPLGDWHAINTELVLFNEQLADKRQIIAYNKVGLCVCSGWIMLFVCVVVGLCCSCV